MRFSAIRRLGVKTCAAVGSTARDLVEFTNLMKPFKSRKLLRHLEGRPSGGPSVPIEPQQLVRVQKGICGSKGERGAGAGQDLINTTRA